jgi:hypothetical protein
MGVLPVAAAHEDSGGCAFVGGTAAQETSCGSAAADTHSVGFKNSRNETEQAPAALHRWQVATQGGQVMSGVGAWAAW